VRSCPLEPALRRRTDDLPPLAVTGYTNEEVCREVLRGGGAAHVDVAVFLNSRDEKMVLGRDDSPPYPLSRCGVALAKRFTCAQLPA